MPQQSKGARINVRQAVLTDVSPLAPLFDAYRQFHGRESDEYQAHEFLLARFNHGESVVLVAEGESGLLGFVQLYPSFSSISLARTLVLNDVYVVPSARRQGVAGALLRAATTYARRVRASRITLSTLIDNVAAQRLYREHGWLPDEQYKVFHKVIVEASGK